ncbi:unnamed protein product [Pieris brassicae]|uniref:Peptidase S1 domain-containing protein n=1 Tax=Pieris brassicae TaxID=7116 RepID=A0A9P0TS94_PIEBR|nr:unnamed protein product [Pieris brassicae]
METAELMAKLPVQAWLSTKFQFVVIKESKNSTSIINQQYVLTAAHCLVGYHGGYLERSRFKHPTPDEDRMLSLLVIFFAGTSIPLSYVVELYN